MKTILHDLGRLPEGLSYPYDELSTLSEWDQDELTGISVDEAWYWYVYGSYEGSGQMLMRRGDLYDVHNLSHCSCNGPTEGVTFGGLSLSSLKENLQKNPEYWKEVKELFEMAEKHG